MTPALASFALACSVCLAAPAASQPEPVSERGSDITVTGERSEPQRPRATTGSRIARSERPAPFATIATETGVAGLVPGSQADPFAGFTRTVTEVSCRSDDERVSADAACRLAAIQRLIAAQSFDEARSAIDRLAASEAATDLERYLAAGFLYRIGLATGEAADREDALRMLVASEAAPAAERSAAYRTLVSIALRRGDKAAARELLERIVATAPEDSRSRANLASLYAETGRAQEAAALVREAIAIARRRGEPVPAEWLSFASSEPQQR
jgi:hypothetical protein